MDCCFLLHYLRRSKIIPVFFSLFFSKWPPIAPLIIDVIQWLSLIKRKLLNKVYKEHISNTEEFYSE